MYSMVPSPSDSGSLLRGWLRTTRDALLVFEASRKGILPRVTRRFHDIEKRSIIKSGVVLVFTEEESGIKRWTDPFLWSPSRMLGNFMIYRERDNVVDSISRSPYSRADFLSTNVNESRDLDLEKAMYGSWNNGVGLKDDGMMKKTISLKIDGIVHHLVSYYKPSDILSGSLRTPSSMPAFKDLEVSSEVLMNVSTLRHPPRTKVHSSGQLIFVDQFEDKPSSRSLKEKQGITWLHPTSPCSTSSASSTASGLASSPLHSKSPEGHIPYPSHYRIRRSLGSRTSRFRREYAHETSTAPAYRHGPVHSTSSVASQMHAMIQYHSNNPSCLQCMSTPDPGSRSILSAPYGETLNREMFWVQPLESYLNPYMQNIATISAPHELYSSYSHQPSPNQGWPYLDCGQASMTSNIQFTPGNSYPTSYTHCA